MLLPNVSYGYFIESLKTYWAEFHYAGYIVGCAKNVGITEYDQGAMRKGWDQAHLGFKYGDTSRFAAYQGPRQIEAAVRSGEQLVEVVARNAARNRNVALSNVLCVPISQRLELRIYLAFAATTFYRQLHLLFVCPPKCQACAIVEQDLHLHHVVNRFPRGLRVHPTRIIAKHSAKGAMGVRCRVGTPGKSQWRRGAAQRIADGARLNCCPALGSIDVENAIQVLAEIEYYRDVATLSCQTCSSASGEDGRTEFLASRDGSENVLLILRNNYADRNLAVIRGVSGIHGSPCGIKVHLALNTLAEFSGKVTPFQLRILTFCVFGSHSLCLNLASEGVRVR